MHLRHIEVFYAVYKDRSISSAARSLGVSQPAISRVLKHAEDRIGYPLFKRTSKGLIPTDEADKLFESARKVFESISQVRRTSLDLKNSRNGRLKVSSVTGLSFELVPRTIARIRRSQPEATFEFQTLHYGDLITSLRDFETDIGLVFEARTHRGLSSLEVGRGEFACVLKDTDPMSSAPEFRRDDLGKLDLIMLNPTGPLGGKMWDAVGGSVGWAEPVALAESCFVARCLVSTGVGAAVVDEFTAFAPGFSGQTARRFETASSFAVNALHLASRPVTGLGRMFLTELANEIELWRAEQSATGSSPQKLSA